jgi:hypothetical protein
MTVGAVYKCAVETVYGGAVDIVNVYHLRETAASPGLSAQQVSDDLKAFMDANMRSMMNTGLVFVRTTAQRMIPNEEDVFQTLWASNVTGTDGNQPSLSCTALLVQLHTSVNSRRGRGRIYLGGMSNFIANMFSWSATNTNRANALMTAMLARYKSGGTPGTLELGIWSRVNGNQHAPFDAAGFQPVTNFTIDPNVRLQRRREFGS